MPGCLNWQLGFLSISLETHGLDMKERDQNILEKWQIYFKDLFKVRLTFDGCTSFPTKDTIDPLIKNSLPSVPKLFKNTNTHAPDYMLNDDLLSEVKS